MMQEITKLEDGQTYEVKPDAGYGDGVTAQVVSISSEDVTLDLEFPNGGYQSLKLVNDDAEIESYLNVCFV